MQPPPQVCSIFHSSQANNLSYFLTSNKIITSPIPIYNFFLSFSQYTLNQQESILNAIIQAIRNVSTNAYVLAEYDADHGERILQIVIALIADNVDNFMLFNLLMQVVELLMQTSTLRQTLLKGLTNKIIADFYQNHISVDHLFATINVFKALYTAKIQADKQPKNMMVFHGNKGLQLIPTKKNSTLGWKFQNGMTLMYWIYIEDIKFGAENKLPKLFTFYSPNKGGVQSYMIDNKIYYRILGSKYTEPQIGSNGINVGELQPKKWNFICFEHEGSKVFMKSKLTIYINKNKGVSFSVDPPKILKNTQTKYIFFSNLYGKCSSVALFANPIGCLLIQQQNKNINSIQNLKRLSPQKLFIFQLMRGKLYQRGGFGYCRDYVLERDLNINMYNVMAIIYVVGFVKDFKDYQVVNLGLDLLVLYCRKSSRNQHNAFLQQYFKMLSMLICRTNAQPFDKNSIKSLLHIKHTITDNQLLDQYFSDFLWPIIGSNCQMQRKQQITQIIKNSFMQNIGHYRTVIGFDEMLNYLVKLQPKTISCCHKHYNLVAKKIDSSSSSNFDFNQVQQIAYRSTLTYIIQLIELYFQSSSINFSEQCYKLCRLLTLKFSGCFILQLIILIKKIISQKLLQKSSESQIKKIMKYFQDKKLYLIFLHVIQNNYFAEIKAQSVKIIYKIFMIRRLDQKQEQQISQRIATALWKINQNHQIQQNEKKSQSNQQKSQSNLQKSQFNNQQSQSNDQIQRNIKGSQKIQINQISQQKIQQNDENNEYQLHQPIKALGLIQIQQDDNRQQYKQVGPIAPKLRNRDNINKKFDFNFVNTTKKKPIQPFKPRMFQKEIVQEQKTIDLIQDKIEQIVLPIKKAKKKFTLEINTEEINQMYNFGGEKGQQIVVSQEQQRQQLQKITKLARICVNAMRKGKGLPLISQSQEIQSIEQIKLQKKTPIMVIPPTTTKNKTLMQRKKQLPLLNFINEQQQQQGTQAKESQQIMLSKLKPKPQLKPEPQLKKSPIQPSPLLKRPLDLTQTISKVPSPISKKYTSSISPSSTKSNPQDNLLSLYNSLLQCCLGMSFQTNLISNSIIQIPSVLGIFYKWIPQTDLETKFINDLEVVTEELHNMELIINMPQTYQFLFELCYKTILMEEINQKRIYVDKLESFFKKVFSYIFQQDPAGHTKLNYIIDWAISKKDQYHPKSLILTTRYVVLMILDSFQQTLIMNKNTSDKIRERNFQSMSSLIQGMLKFLPCVCQQSFIISSQRILLTPSLYIISTLSPFFKNQWLDQSACKKYFYLFKKYFSTQWYNKGLQRLGMGETNFVQAGVVVLQKEASYFLKDNFLVSLLQITKAQFVNQVKATQGYQELAKEMLWQLSALIILSQTNKQKTIKNQKTQRILCFLKNLKCLISHQVNETPCIIPIMSSTKHFLAIAQLSQKPSSSIAVSQNGILDQLLCNYIPQELLKMSSSQNLQAFKLHFSDVWIPSENHYKKIHSELFRKYKERTKGVEDKQEIFIQVIANIIEEQGERYFCTEQMVEIANRITKNKFRKMWERLRIYSDLWKIPELKMQIDTLFNKSIYSFQKYTGNHYYNYKISKHQSKAKARYFLKARLFNPNISMVQKSSQLLNQKAFNSALHLQKAIMYSSTSLSLSKSLTNWLYQKCPTFQPLMPFKKVHLVNTLTLRSGRLAIINDKLIFVSNLLKEKANHLAIKQYQIQADKSWVKLWNLEYVKDVLRRRFVNRKRAVQITFIHGKSVLIQFQQENDIDQFFKKFAKLKGTKCPNLSYISKTSDAKKVFQNYGYLAKWNTFQMSNFEYLMQLNNISGRSYSDTTQYPILPWVLANHSTVKLHLSQQQTYRNLSLPMGALGSTQRTSTFSQRYQMLSVDGTSQKRFHYGTHYSSPGIIYHFLIRLYPFTQGGVLLQSGKFDFADRLFYSVADSWRNAITEHSDVRELLPEMYTLPEVYLNVNKQDFGVMQSKKRVNNVELPQWARDNPYLFVTKMRKMMQEPRVSQNINKWIDLIFGYKQKGQQSVQSLNCFYYLTYEDAVDWDNIQDQKQVYALESQIMNFGQTPSQIFIKSHIKRQSISTMKNFNAVCDPGAQIKVYRPSKNRNLLQQQAQLNPLKQIACSIIHMKWVKDDRLVFMRRSGDIFFYKLQAPSTGSKVPFQCAIQKQKKLSQMLSSEQKQFGEYSFDPSLDVGSFPIQFINKGNAVCLGGLLDGRMILVDVETQAIIETYQNHQYTISCLKADSKDNFLITGDVKGNVIVWRLVSTHNTYKLTLYQSFHDQKDQITSIFFSYELKCFAVSSMDGSVFLYNIITGKKLKAYYHPSLLPINEIIISTNPLASLVIFSNKQGLIYCYSINGQLIQRVHQKQSQNFLSPTLLKDFNGFQYLSYGNQNGQTIIRTMPYLDKPIKHKVASKTVVNRVCNSRNGRFLVTGCSDGELSILTDPNTYSK